MAEYLMAISFGAVFSITGIIFIWRMKHEMKSWGEAGEKAVDEKNNN